MFVSCGFGVVLNIGPFGHQDQTKNRFTEKLPAIIRKEYRLVSFMLSVSISFSSLFLVILRRPFQIKRPVSRRARGLFKFHLHWQPDYLYRTRGFLPHDCSWGGEEFSGWFRGGEAKRDKWTKVMLGGSGQSSEMNADELIKEEPIVGKGMGLVVTKASQGKWARSIPALGKRKI